ncbi:hypothetical protein G5C51_20565 [Streptomyces sp. A7024]|uniref:Uncharacterized protein n=1 Tax=Streptomyces coryli TaxID=1128680 RepID=A0A6G4U4Z5_9ACTN|nr:hypothetical protein [Streptomyces coryli]NGN66281.1 hypothetical protein [Streptomyces coryli]
MQFEFHPVSTKFQLHPAVQRATIIALLAMVFTIAFLTEGPARAADPPLTTARSCHDAGGPEHGPQPKPGGQRVFVREQWEGDGRSSRVYKAAPGYETERPAPSPGTGDPSSWETLKTTDARPAAALLKWTM